MVDTPPLNEAAESAVINNRRGKYGEADGFFLKKTFRVDQLGRDVSQSVRLSSATSCGV